MGYLRRSRGPTAAAAKPSDLPPPAKEPVIEPASEPAEPQKEEPPAAAAEEEVRYACRSCRQPLQRVVSSAEEELECDGPCGGELRAGCPRFSCEACDFDCCAGCVGRLAEEEEEGAPPPAPPPASSAHGKRKRVGLPPAAPSAGTAPVHIVLAGSVAREEAEALAGAAHALGRVTTSGPHSVHSHTVHLPFHAAHC